MLGPHHSLFFIFFKSQFLINLDSFTLITKIMFIIKLFYLIFIKLGILFLLNNKLKSIYKVT